MRTFVRPVGRPLQYPAAIKTGRARGATRLSAQAESPVPGDSGLSAPEPGRPAPPSGHEKSHRGCSGRKSAASGTRFGLRKVLEHSMGLPRPGEFDRPLPTERPVSAGSGPSVPAAGRPASLLGHEKSHCGCSGRTSAASGTRFTPRKPRKLSMGLPRPGEFDRPLSTERPVPVDQGLPCPLPDVRHPRPDTKKATAMQWPYISCLMDKVGDGETSKTLGASRTGRKQRFVRPVGRPLQHTSPRARPVAREGQLDRPPKQNVRCRSIQGSPCPHPDVRRTRFTPGKLRKLSARGKQAACGRSCDRSDARSNTPPRSRRVAREGQLDCPPKQNVRYRSIRAFRARCRTSGAPRPDTKKATADAVAVH